MNELIEDYQRKINSVNELLKDISNSEDTISRLKIKVGCYRSFLTDLKRALNIDLVSCLFSAEKVEEAYDDGHYDGQIQRSKTFDIETYS